MNIDWLLSVLAHVMNVTQSQAVANWMVGCFGGVTTKSEKAKRKRKVGKVKKFERKVSFIDDVKSLLMQEKLNVPANSVVKIDFQSNKLDF